MGRITKVFDGNDKIVQVVELKTSSGLFIRPVNKLVLLMKNDIEVPSLRSAKENNTDEEWTTEDTDEDWQQGNVNYNKKKTGKPKLIDFQEY